MINKNIHILLLFILLNSLFAYSQQDSTILTYDEFIQVILKEHPVAKQAYLNDRIADAERLGARGNFDPEIMSNLDEKLFDEKQYFRIFSNKLRVPTPIGLDITGTYENTQGVFLNPQNSTDLNGLWSVGIEANVLQGLLIDERRTALRQAEIFRDMARNRQIMMINELLLNATEAYIEWQKYYEINNVLLQSIDVAEEYFQGTRQSFLGGEKTAVDTLEALLIVQDRTAQQQSNLSFLVKSQQNLQNFLWYQGLPVELEDATIPESIGNELIDVNTNRSIDSLAANHPELQEKQFKREMLEAEQRLKVDKLKPKLKVKYNPLLGTTEESIEPIFSQENYKWGVDFSFPLFLRSERAEIRKNRLKIENIDFDIDNKRNELLNKIRASLQQQEIFLDQIAIQENNIDGYETLLEAENQRFIFGESSVFLLNKRQEKFIDSQIKLIKILADYEKEKIKYQFYTNTIR